MVRHPSSYTRLTLSQKHKICAKAAAEVAWNPRDLATWATQEFKTATPVGKSTVRGILKRKSEFDEVPETQFKPETTVLRRPVRVKQATARSHKGIQRLARQRHCYRSQSAFSGQDHEGRPRRNQRRVALQVPAAHRPMVLAASR
ncbi:hypothetical protein PC116_g27718 [Phytophthora cactorum]|nr:hypothetical protein PC116_g27718 [Phytophthora cactorum]